MDALMAGFVAAILAQAGDRGAWLAAILADRYRRPATVIVATALALAACNAIGAVGGALLQPLMAPEARQLLLGLALVSAGGSGLFAPKPPERLDGWRIGAVATTLLGLFILFFGDRTQFIAAALAVRSPVPALAAVGTTLGSLVVIVPAILLGERDWLALPLRWLRLGGAVALIVAGLVIGLGAVGLI